jgi:hypothetical protein
VNLLPDEEKVFSVYQTPDVFSVINETTKRVVIPGKFILFTGGYQPVKADDPDILTTVIALK